jgi:hypothetical protein
MQRSNALGGKAVPEFKTMVQPCLQRDSERETSLDPVKSPVSLFVTCQFQSDIESHATLSSKKRRNPRAMVQLGKEEILYFCIGDSDQGSMLLTPWP